VFRQRRPALDSSGLFDHHYPVVIGLLYIASGKIELEEDEAYQWIWSKHLALSYYSKPPLIAYSHFLSTSLWGDTAFGVRFFAPVIAAALSWLSLRFLVREVNARAAFWLSIILGCVPILAVGSTLMTIDPLSVLFWTLAMFAGWRAVREDATTGDWLWVGLWMGFGFLSKYTELFQLLSWALLFILWPPARKHLRRPGPYLALLVNLLCMFPCHHVELSTWMDHRPPHCARRRARQALASHATNLWAGFTRYSLGFLIVEAGLLNPVFFIAAAWAAVRFWRRKQEQRPLMMYLFIMGAPVFLCYFLLTFRSRVLPNWIAPAVLPFSA